MTRHAQEGVLTRIAACVLAMVAVDFSATAALKYETDSYAAQDALVLHLDGIRNVGALLAHDDAATKWVNLANPSFGANLLDYTGTYTTGEDGHSEWLANAYRLDANKYWQTETLAGSDEVTIEVFGDFAVAQPSDYANYISKVTSTDMGIWIKSGALRWKVDVDSLGFSDRPEIASWDRLGFSAVISASNCLLYSHGEVGTKTVSRSEPHNSLANSQYNIGCNYKAATYPAKGDYNAVRVYNRALTQDEIRRNYELDQIRFVTGIPVTNAVVATSVAGAEGVESSGVYAVDGSHDFSAPATATVGGTTYVCTGYTRETWDGGAWSAPVSVAGFRASVADGEKVRITWQWAVASGSLSNGYATDGLVLWYDGIWNAGFGAHDASAAKWMDLSPTRNDAVLNTTGDETFGSPGWTDGTGYSFYSNAWFEARHPLNPGVTFTVQTVGDFNRDGAGLSPYSMLLYVGNNNRSDFFQLYRQLSNSRIVLNADNITGNDSSRRARASWEGRYTTAALSRASIGGYDSWLFEGTNYPSGAIGYYPGKTTAACNFDTATWGIGNAPYPSGAEYRLSRYYTGKINAVRVYSRKLTEAELAQNRAVDDARFFGIGTVAMGTPVTIAPDVRGLTGREKPGVYFPLSWTFSSGSATQKVNGRSYRPCGYIVETWDADTSTWRVSETSDSAMEWTSPGESSSVGLRLTWKWKAVQGIRSASDYDVGDYVQGGLSAWLDGIRNADASSLHDDAATTWADISYRRSPVTLKASAESHWTDDGYYFGKNNASSEISYALLADRLSLGTNGTIEVACDLDMSIQTAKYGQLVAFNYDGDNNYDTSVYLQGTSDCRWKADSWSGGGSASRANITNPWNGRHAAFVMDISSYCSYKDGVVDQTFERAKQARMPTVYWSVGNKYYTSMTTNTQLVGTMKAVRVYNRPLSQEEIAHNWKVDVARFDGLLTVTNVVVAGKHADYEGVAAGVYEVDGEYTFTAGSATDGKGNVREVVGYTIEAWNPAAGTWGAPETHSGSSYTYTSGIAPAKVRLTWKWQPDGTMIVVF